MQPTRVLFQTEAGLLSLSLIDRYEEGSHFDGAVPVALRPEERIRLIAADSGKTLAFTRVDVPMGCLLADPAAGR